MRLSRDLRVPLIALFIPIMLPHVVPEPLRWIWMTLASLWMLKKLGILHFGIDIAIPAHPDQQHDASGRDRHSCPKRAHGATVDSHSTFVGEIISRGRAPFEFDDTNTKSFFITLKLDSGDHKTVWGVGLAQVVSAHQLCIGDRVMLKYLDRQPVTVNKPVYDQEGALVDHHTVKTHRNIWQATKLQA